MTKKKVAIIQSNYISWKGYFDIINEARSGQIRWADAIYTSKGIRDKVIAQFGEGAGSGW